MSLFSKLSSFLLDFFFVKSGHMLVGITFQSGLITSQDLKI